MRVSPVWICCGLLWWIACTTTTNRSPSVDGSQTQSDGAVCTPTTCTELAADCGQQPDGCGGIRDCGVCNDGLTCGGLSANRCGEGECTPTTCVLQNTNCGQLSDGCGALLDCGICDNGNVCVLGNCIACEVTVRCGDQDCGTKTDNCGGLLDCGLCTADKLCGDGKCETGETCSSCETDCGACNPGTVGDLGHGEGATSLSFENSTAKAGLLEPLNCMKGHAAAFGDFNADGFADLFFGTFADKDSSQYPDCNGARPNRLFVNDGKGGFSYLKSNAVEQMGRSSGGAFVDLDNDGDLDLVTTHNSTSSKSDASGLSNLVYRNDDGLFVDVTNGSGLSFPTLPARNVVPLDYDGDRDLDLFIVSDQIRGSSSGRLLRNNGGFKFTDVTTQVGLRDNGGLGAAAGDLNNDGWPDLYVIDLEGKDTLYLNDGAGKLVPQSSSEFHVWQRKDQGEDWPAGVSFGDVNRDGWLDIVVGQHFGSAASSPQSLKLFINQGNGKFRDRTSSAAIAPIGSKAPHVEFQDFDNDGWVDIYASVHVDVNGKMAPLIFTHSGSGTSPTFSANSTKVRTDYGIGYTASGPTVDYDRDGRLDVLMPEWEAAFDSVLYRNTSEAGNFVEVQVRPDAAECNAMGIGARVEIYEQGKLAQPAALIGRSEIMTGFGYSSAQEAIVHFGVADRQRVDLRVILPHGGRTIDRPNVGVNTRIPVP